MDPSWNPKDEPNEGVPELQRNTFSMIDSVKHRKIQGSQEI